MTIHATSRITTVAVLACLALFSAEAFAQAQGQVRPPGSREVCQPFEGRCLVIQPPSNLRPTPTGWQPPRTREGRPDFTGVYAGAGFSHQIGRNDTDTPIIRGFDAKAMAAVKPGGEKILFRPFTGDLKIDDPIALCLPYGFTSQIFSPYAQQWVHAPNHLIIKHEFMNNFSRIIPLDGRPHPEDLEPTWGGHSVGRWDGDELVIDTVGLKEWWLDNPHPKGSLWHSDAAHIIERVKWIGPDLVSYQVTVDDPKIWTTAWTEQFHMVLHRTWELLEFVCNENDRCSGGKCTPSEAQRQ